MMLFNANASNEAQLMYPDHLAIEGIHQLPRCKNDLLALTGIV
jgi:hypothetical protein